MRVAHAAPMVGAFFMLWSGAGAARAEADDLEVLYRAEMEMAAAQLRMKPDQVDDRLALTVVATGVTWQPSAGGVSLFRQGQKHLEYTGWAGRIEGFRAAARGRDARAEFAFALSLVLDPAPDPAIWRNAFAAAARYGASFDTVLIGIITAPSRVPFLASLQYAAADTLIWRADTRHTQFWLSLVDSRDSYLRSRAIAAIGILAYDPSATGTTSPGTTTSGLLMPVRESPISAAQRRMFEDVLLRASSDRSYRVRAAAALGLGLVGGPDARSKLTRLVRDSSYVVVPGAPAGMRRLAFPVREAAANALKRYGLNVPPSGGDYGDKEFRQAVRGCRDVTKDTAGMRKGVTSKVRFYDGYW